MRFSLEPSLGRPYSSPKPRLERDVVARRVVPPVNRDSGPVGALEGWECVLFCDPLLLGCLGTFRDVIC
jgi:hypothetical protein